MKWNKPGNRDIVSSMGCVIVQLNGNPLAIKYGETDRQTTVISLINGFFDNPVHHFMFSF